MLFVAAAIRAPRSSYSGYTYADEAGESGSHSPRQPGSNLLDNYLIQPGKGQLNAQEAPDLMNGHRGSGAFCAGPNA